MADKEDPLSQGYWNDRRHLLNFGREKPNLYGKSPDAKARLERVQTALEHFDSLPQDEALRAIRGIYPSGVPEGSLLAPLNVIPSWNRFHHTSPAEYQRIHATFELTGRIVLGRLAERLPGAAQDLQPLDSAVTFGSTPWPNPAPSHADRNHSLVASTDRPLFGLLTTELKSRLKDWENLIGNFKTDRQRFIQRMERKWGPVSMWSEAIYSVCARKENSLDGVSEVLLKEMASLAEAGMKWSHFRDNNTPRVNVTTGDVQKLTGGVTKRTLQALVQAIKAGSRSGNASSENIPDRSTDEPLPTETMVEHAAVDGSLDPGLLGLPEVAAHAEPDELAEWEPDESTVISSTDRPRSVSILRERPDGKLKGEPRLNEAIWRDFFHPIRGFRPQSRYWSTGDTQRPIETSYVFRKTGEERAPYDKVWVNRISPVSPNDCVVSIWQLKILFLELARPFPRLPSCVEVQSGDVDSYELIHYVNRRYFFAEKEDQKGWRMSTRNQFWHWLKGQIPNGYEHEVRHRQWVGMLGQPPAYPLEESLESLYNDGKVDQTSIGVIQEHVKLLGRWNRPDAMDKKGTARGKLPLPTYAQDHPAFRIAQAGFASLDHATNARRLITVMQGYAALAVQSDDPNVDDVEVVMLGPGNSVLIPPGRQVYWEAVTDFILLENLEWVIGSTSFDTMHRPAPSVQEPVWHNQMINCQLELLKRELFAISQYTEGMDTVVVDRIFAVQSRLTNAEETSSWARVTDVLRQIRLRCEMH